MNNGEYEIVRYQPQYRKAVLELLAPLWGPDQNRAGAYLDWKHFRNPYVQHPFIYCVLHNRVVVGAASHAASCWQAGQARQRFLCVAGADAVVLPDHRRQGLHGGLTSAALKELEDDKYEFDICLGSNQTSSLSAIKLGWAQVGELRRMQWQATQTDGRLRRIACRTPLLPAVYRKFHEKLAANVRSGGHSLHPFHTLDHNYDHAKRPYSSGIVLEKEPRPQAMATLVNRRPNDGRIAQVRDKEFFAWRYENPLSVYRFLFLDDGDLQGYLVLQQPFDGHSDSVFIVDWETDSTKVFSTLVRWVIQWGGFSSINIWSVTLEDVTTSVLIKCGFRQAGENTSTGPTVYWPPIIVKPLHLNGSWSMSGRNLLDLSNWDLRPIYSDSY